jgi:hypothetical protein
MQNCLTISVYIDASPACNDIAFQLGNAASVLGPAVSTKQWNIKVIQSVLSDGLDQLAPRKSLTTAILAIVNRAEV